jgi:hypothetical protein
MSNIAELATANAEGPTFLDYVAHPLANTFPMITGTPMEELQDNVRRNGILEPIRLWQGMILDGATTMPLAKPSITRSPPPTSRSGLAHWLRQRRM